MAKNNIQAITMTSINTNTLSGSFLPINSAGLPEPCVLIRIINDSDTDMTVSYDGTNDHDYVRTGSTLELNLQTNSLPNGNVAQLARGTIVYVKAAAGTGLVYLAGYYQPI